MKKHLNFLLVAIMLLASNPVQLIAQAHRDAVLYTFFLNVAPDGWRAPQIGFINRGMGDFESVQLGFINTIGGHLNGAQGGFVNSVGGTTNGIQWGFVNTTAQSLNGIGVGFVNAVGASTAGIQVGFVNTTAENLDGIQVGFVNVTGGDVNGPQVGFVNNASRLDGIQIGFVNVCDTLEGGFPLGFISVVKRGGYKAFGVYADEMSPLNLSFRIGIKQLYTSIQASYFENNYHKLSFGAAIGTILPIRERFFFNPEYSSMTLVLAPETVQQHNSLIAAVGYNIDRKLHILAGPSFSWNHTRSNVDLLTPYFSFGSHVWNTANRFDIGFKAGLYYTL